MSKPRYSGGNSTFDAISLVDSDDEEQVAAPPTRLTVPTPSRASGSGSRGLQVPTPKSPASVNGSSAGPSSERGNGNSPSPVDSLLGNGAQASGSGQGATGMEKGKSKEKGKKRGSIAESERPASRSITKKQSYAQVIEISSDEDQAPPNVSPSKPRKEKGVPRPSPAKGNSSTFPNPQSQAPNAFTSASLDSRSNNLPPPGSGKKSGDKSKPRISMADKPHMTISAEPETRFAAALSAAAPSLAASLGVKGPNRMEMDEEEPATSTIVPPARPVPSGPSFGRKRLASSDAESVLPDNFTTEANPLRRKDNSPHKMRKGPSISGQSSRLASEEAGPSRRTGTSPSSNRDPIDIISRANSRPSISTPNVAGPSTSRKQASSSPDPIMAGNGELDFSNINFGPDTIIDDLADDDALVRALRDLDESSTGGLDLGGFSGDVSMRSSPVFRPSDLTTAEVEEAIVDATNGVDEVEITDTSSPNGATEEVRTLGHAATKMKNRFAAMTKAEKIAFLESNGQISQLDKGDGKRRGSGSSNDQGESSSVDQVEQTISKRFSFRNPRYPPKPKSIAITIESSPEPDHSDILPRAPLSSALDGIPAADHPPDKYRDRNVRREFETDWIDKYNLAKPTFTKNPSLHRTMFQQFMYSSTEIGKNKAKEIGVVAAPGTDGDAPEMEYQYGNDVMYHSHVPDPDTGAGCGCVGPCDPNDRSCRCVRRQELYFYDTKLTGFAYNPDGTVKNYGVPVWECGPNCGCPPSCMNRVIQRGRGEKTELELFKTKNKGWGVRARYAIPYGTLLGMYSGEIIPDYESERRGILYNQIGRTYLFDLDGWQVRHPPDMDKLREVDPRLAELAEQSVQRYEAVLKDAGETEMDGYSAYSMDAFHYGFTRYFNHSCDPNLSITQAYVGDYHPERPKLVMFTYRPIAAGEELCISYMGIDPDAVEAYRQPAPANKSGKSRNRSGKRSKNKTSAKAHISADKSVRLGCKCGSWNCKGMMFASGGDGA